MTNAKFSIPRTPKLSCRLRPDKKEEKTAATIKLFFAFRKAGRKYSREPGLKFPGDHVARRGSERKEGEGGHGSGKIAVFEAGGGGRRPPRHPSAQTSVVTLAFGSWKNLFPPAFSGNRRFLTRGRPRRLGKSK